MPISLLARGPGAQEQQEVAELVFAELRDVDCRFSPYLRDSDLSRLNRGEVGWTNCHESLVEVRGLCLQASAQTGGLFDAMLPSGRWDPSGLVKGWAAERASRHLVASGLDWCLNAGGDVVVVARSGTPFAVGIQDPRDRGALSAVLRTTQCVATSGTTARGAHLYDPRTGAAAVLPWLSVTVAGPSLMTCDVVATAAMVAGASWEPLLPRGYAGLAIDAFGELHPSAGWPSPAA